MLAHLGPVDDETLTTVANCLGFGSKGPQDYRQHGSKRGVWEHKNSKTNTPSHLPSPPTYKNRNSGVAAVPPSSPQGEELDFELIQQESEFTVESLPEQSPEFESATPITQIVPAAASCQRRPSLYPQRTYRNIVSALVAQPAQGFEIDIERLIEEACLQRFLQQVPMKPRFSTQVHCQLLLDYNEVLRPLWDDLTALTYQIQTVTGVAGCEVFEFDSNPQQAHRWSEEGEEVVWQADKNKFVIVVTDFGQLNYLNKSLSIGYQAWLSFYQKQQERGVDMVFLTPLEKHDYPTTLTNHLPIVHWGKSIRASDVKRLKAEGKHVLG